MGAEEEFYGDRGVGGGNSLAGQESSETIGVLSSVGLGGHIHLKRSKGWLQEKRPIFTRSAVDFLIIDQSAPNCDRPNRR